MPTTTPMQSLPIPTEGDDPDVPDDLASLANAIEKRLVGIYNNVSDRSTRVTAPQEGMVAYMKDSHTFTFYNGSAWTLMFPAQVSVSSGTSVPSNSVGNDGDLFFKTS